jgi:hypothetical protein
VGGVAGVRRQGVREQESGVGRQEAERRDRWSRLCRDGVGPWQSRVGSGACPTGTDRITDFWAE